MNVDCAYVNKHNKSFGHRREKGVPLYVKEGNFGKKCKLQTGPLAQRCIQYSLVHNITAELGSPDCSAVWSSAVIFLTLYYLFRFLCALTFLATWTL